MSTPRPLSGSRRLCAYALLLVACPALLLFIVVPLSVPMQLLLGVALIVLMLLLNRRKSFAVTVAMVTLSLAVSTRYLYWRTTQTLDFENSVETFFGMGLYLAEVYAWLILVLGYFQCLMPLNRPVAPLPEDTSTWPSVDVYVPTYNESLEVVQDTVLAALDLDYPPEKLRVYLLDDGRRPEFRAFAEAAGAGYIARSDNAHAKAGNLNHALKLTDGELICIFDCDHVGTRAFLQSTVGLFLKDPKLALVQTPHHFYSPDPFERNLATGKDVPNEGELFYGPVQQGNDYWNAAFFCGSCAVIRRAALEQTNGFAVETVTEDAHTALKLQRKGWGTAFIAVPLAAGLATERLALHIGQRMRWARGMTQIMRRDNPLLGRGLSLPQRLCYLNAMLHFQFALPRVVFLTAPIAFLLLGQNIIASSAAAILAYALPHLVHAITTNARIQGRHRHSFWGEIYETALAFHLLGPTLVTLFAPKRGKFNVTDKGGLLDKSFFDHRMVRPHLITIALLVLAIGIGLARYFWAGAQDVGLDVLAINILWACFSLIVLFAAVAVARETRQLRSATRLPLRLPATLYLANGRTLRGETCDVSMTGLRLRCPGTEQPLESIEDVELTARGRTAAFPVEFAGFEDGAVRLRFAPLPLPQRRVLVSLVMGRADAWLRDQPRPSDQPLKSLGGVLKNALALFARRAHPATPPLTSLQRGAGQPRLLLSLALLALTLLSLPAWSATSAGEQAEPLVEVLDFRRLGQPQGLTLRGSQAQAGLSFSLSRQQVVAAAELLLHVSHEPHLPAGSRLLVGINGEPLAEVDLVAEHPVDEPLRLTLDPRLLLPQNRLDLRLDSALRCDDPQTSPLLVTLGKRSAVTLTLRRLDLHNDLALLPAPFFGQGQMNRLRLPMVLPREPDAGVLRSAALVASHFGALAGRLGADFPVLYDQLPRGNAILFAPAGRAVAGVRAPIADGAGLALVDNPRDPLGKLLIISGTDAADLHAAAARLALDSGSLHGSAQQVSAPEALARQPYDAPNWIPGGRSVRFDEISQGALSSDSITPASMSLSFRAAPDTFVWNAANIPMLIHYRFPEGDWFDAARSRLDVALNGKYLTSLPVLKTGLVEKIRNHLGQETRQQEALIEIPAYLISGDNRLDFFFDIQRRADPDCSTVLPEHAISEIDGSSYIDFSGTTHFAQLPDLSLFASSGFPFTRLADLSQTAVLMPLAPTTGEVEAMLGLLGHFGKATGYPALGVEVLVGTERLSEVHSRDLLALGFLDRRLDVPTLLGDSPYRLDQQRLDVRHPSLLEEAHARVVLGDWARQHREAQRYVGGEAGFRGLIARQSPYHPERVLLMTLAGDEAWLPRMVSNLDQPAIRRNMRGDLTYFESEQQVHGFRTAALFVQGELPWSVRVRWLLGERPVLLMSLLLIAALLVTAALHPLLRDRAARRLH